MPKSCTAQPHFLAAALPKIGPRRAPRADIFGVGFGTELGAGNRPRVANHNAVSRLMSSRNLAQPEMNCGRDIGPDSLADSRDNGQSGVTYARSDGGHFETLRTFSCDAMLRI